MAAITVTAGSVAILSGNAERVTYGEAITQGQPVREVSGKYYMCNHTTSTDAAAAGIALTPGATDAYGYIVRHDEAQMLIPASAGAMTVGNVYCVGATDGAIVPFADLATGDYLTILGTCIAADTLRLGVVATGVALP